MITGHENEKYALIGKKLSYSYSVTVHKEFADYAYELLETTETDLPQVLQNKEYSGFNVTIPYKQTVIPYLDRLSREARKTGAVNTVVRRGKKLYGYNTDCDGFRAALAAKGIRPRGKKCMILGSGGASHAAAFVLKKAGAARVTVISRSGKDNYHTLDRFADTQILINATPVGMYPGTGFSPLSLDLFPRLEFVFDMIYNPFRTELLINAEARGIPAENGLSMLAYQAAASAELFTRGHVSDAEKKDAAAFLRRYASNIVLIGMPGGGKSTLARILGGMIDRKVYDTDELIKEKTGRKPADIIQTEGISIFRRIETRVVAEIADKTNAIIATGGGVPLSEENRRYLKRNGFIIHLIRPAEELDREGRPLSDDLTKMEEERLPIYRAFADAEVAVARTVNETILSLLEVITR